MNHEMSGYGLWLLAAINIAIFVSFAFSFFKPQTKTDWRTFGAFSGFLVALFVEMYGFPLTIYLLSGWLQTKVPGLDIFSHDAGHIWYALLGFEGDPHANPIHVASNVIIVGGFVLLSASWKVLFEAQREGKLARDGTYGFVRHPQYVAFILILFGFLLQWPTLLTLLMFPVLLVMYVRLAHSEEKAVAAEFGAEWDAYARETPRWIPRLKHN